MSRVDVTLGGKNAGFKKMLTDSRREAKKFGSGVQGALNLGNAFSAANLGAQLIGSVKALVNTVLDEFDRLAKIGRRVDMDPGQVQKYGMVAKLAGSDIETMNKAWSDMVKSGAKAEGGLKSYLREFEALNVNVKDFNKASTEEKFLILADAYAKADDKGKAYNAMSIVMGRSARELAPLLMQGADGIRAMVDEMDAADAADFAAIEKLNDDMAVLGNQLKTAAAQTLPGFFGVLRTGWNGLSIIVNKVIGYVFAVIGAMKVLADTTVAWGDKVDRMGVAIDQAMQAARDGMAEDVNDIKDAWDGAGSSVDGYSDSLRDAQKEANKLELQSDKLRAKEEAARKKAEAAKEREAAKALSDAERVAKEKLAMDRKLQDKRGEILILNAKIAGDNDEVKRLERVVQLRAKYVEYSDNLGQGRERSIELAKQELSMEEKLAALKAAQASKLEALEKKAENKEKERDGFTRLANGLSGGVDSLQSIGLGVAGARYGENKEVVKLREMAVVRNRELMKLNENIQNLEVEIAEAEF